MLLIYRKGPRLLTLSQKRSEARFVVASGYMHFGQCSREQAPAAGTYIGSSGDSVHSELQQED